MHVALSLVIDSFDTMTLVLRERICPSAPRGIYGKLDIDYIRCREGIMFYEHHLGATLGSKSEGLSRTQLNIVNKLRARLQNEIIFEHCAYLPAWSRKNCFDCDCENVDVEHF